jgi:uncharacterized protein
MQTREVMTTTAAETEGAPKPIAAWWHLVGFLLIMAGTAFMGFRAQHASAGPSSSGQLAQHGQAISLYLVAGFMDWALLYYCWVGVHRRGGSLATLSGGRWTSWNSLASDVAIAVPFWGVWEGTAYAVHWMLGSSDAKSIDSLLPHSLVEVLLWIALSITAGFCEELAFRGYLQRQFQALSGSIAVAVLAQALVFGIAHSYQGWKSVVVICVLGALYGALAAWRGNLRANIISHAASDIWEGWLKQIIFR